MSLKLSNRVTDKQRELLRKLEYRGNFDLTVEQAADIIDGLIEQQAQESDQYIEIDGERIYTF